MVFYYRKSRVSIAYSSLKHLSYPQSFASHAVMHLSFLLRTLVFTCLVFALARPQLGRTETERKTEGLDMVLALDTSESMSQFDFWVNGRRRDRLFVVKSVVAGFIEKRFDDRLGLVVFGTQAYSQAPLTLDHDVLQTYLEGVSIGMAGRSTAIGDALGVSINAIKNVKSKNKIIILLTDGENRTGKLDPLQMIEVAKAIGVKIYTIGVGRVGIDEALLNKIAKGTGGLYFKAENTETLVKIYESIDKLEKTELKVKSYRSYEEKFSSFLWVGFFLLLFEILLSASRFRRVP